MEKAKVKFEGLVGKARVRIERNEIHIWKEGSEGSYLILFEDPSLIVEYVSPSGNFEPLLTDELLASKPT